MKPSQVSAIRDAVARALKYTVGDAQRELRINPNDHDDDVDGPTIDVRLCIDGERWTIRSGPVDYDPYHSKICVASLITPSTDADDLADELIDLALDAVAEADFKYWKDLGEHANAYMGRDENE